MAFSRWICLAHQIICWLRLSVLTVTASLLAATGMARAASQADLDASFLAAFGHPPPLIRQTFMPSFYSGLERGESEPWPITVQLTPERLIPLGPSRWALIVKETIQEIGHLYGGAIAVAYLQHRGQLWRKEDVWPEVFYSGFSGVPANGGSAVRHFGAAPLYLATSEWCGQGTCDDSIQVMQLDSSGPRYLGEILGGAWFPWEVADLEYDGFDCESYGYSAKIMPPQTRKAVLSVIYAGWHAPVGQIAPKTRFRYRVDIVPKGDDLAMRPAAPIPTCAR